MNPKIESTRFGAITVSGETYTHDILIHTSGEISKRKKKLSKSKYGTSHILSKEEAKALYEPDAVLLIFGGGQYNRCRLSDEAAAYFTKKGCEVKILPTPEAVEAWNEADGKIIGLFHITC